MGSQVRVYVKSVKTLTGTEQFERRTPMVSRLGDYPDRVELEGKIPDGTFVVKTYATETELMYEFVLPEKQQVIVDLTKKIASELGLEVKVIDVGKENVLHRAIQKEFEKIRVFPTLVSDSGAATWAVAIAFKRQGDVRHEGHLADDRHAEDGA